VELKHRAFSASSLDENVWSVGFTLLNKTLYMYPLNKRLLEPMVVLEVLIKGKR